MPRRCEVGRPAPSSSFWLLYQQKQTMLDVKVPLVLLKTGWNLGWNLGWRSG
jgi:hypothetical protein